MGSNYADLEGPTAISEAHPNSQESGSVGSRAGCGRGEGPAAARPLLGDAGMFTLLTAAAAGGGAEPRGWAAARLAVGSAGRAGWEPPPAAARGEAIGRGSRTPQLCIPRGSSCPGAPVSLHGPAGWGRCGERAGRVEPRARVSQRIARDACHWRSVVQAAGCRSSDPGRFDPREAPPPRCWRQQVSRLRQEEIQRRPASGTRSLVTLAIYRSRIGSTDSAVTLFRKVKFLDKEWSVSGGVVGSRTYLLKPIQGWDAAEYELSYNGEKVKLERP